MAIPRGYLYHSLAFDLRSLAMLPFSALDDPAVLASFESNLAAFLGSRYAVALPMARSAVYLALKARALPKGSRIIMPPITISEMMDVVLVLGLEPVFVDLELETFCFDTNALKKAITSDTSAMLLTFLYGLVPDMPTLLGIAREAGLFVVEDFSHNLGARCRGRALGTFGDVGVYSSSTIKTLDTFGGGLLFSDDDGLVDGIRRLAAELPRQGRRRRLALRILESTAKNIATMEPVFSGATFPLLRWSRAGHPVLYRLLSGAGMPGKAPANTLPDSWRQAYSAFQASAGLALLPGLRADDARRRRNTELLLDALSDTDLCLPRELPHRRNVYWQLLVLCDQAAALQDALARHGVDSATSNLDLLSESPLYPRYRRATPRARYIKDHGVFLPVHPRLSTRQVAFVASALRRSCRELCASGLCPGSLRACPARRRLQGNPPSSTRAAAVDEPLSDAGSTGCC